MQDVKNFRPKNLGIPPRTMPLVIQGWKAGADPTALAMRLGVPIHSVTSHYKLWDREGGPRQAGLFVNKADGKEAHQPTIENLPKRKKTRSKSGGVTASDEFE